VSYAVPLNAATLVLAVVEAQVMKLDHAVRHITWQYRKPVLREIRGWARANAYEVADWGVIPAPVVAAFQAAQ
jgi:hypothetical protein